MSLKFGKYKGKTFEYVYRVDKGYCSWFINNCKGGNDFKDFIKKRGLFNRTSIINKTTTATDLAKKICHDPVIVEALGDILLGEGEEVEGEDEDDLEDDPIVDVEENDPDWDNLPHWESADKPIIAYPRKNITAQLYGQFVDYYVRYRIAFLTGKRFVDKAVEYVIEKKIPGFGTIEKAYEELQFEDECEHHFVLKCSVASTLSRGSKRDFKALRRNLRLCDDVVKRVDEFIDKEILKKEFGGSVILNPKLSSNLISAHADITTQEGVIDIKTGRDNISYYLSQLMIYAVLFKKKYGNAVKNITIFNPTVESHTTTLSISEEKVIFFEEYLKNLGLLK